MLIRRILLGLIVGFVFIGVVSAAFFPESYSALIKYENETVLIQDVYKIQKNSFVGSVQGDYCIRSIAFDSSIMKSSCFNFPLEASVTYEQECYEESGVLNASKCGGSLFISGIGFKGVYLPFSPGAEFLEVVDKDKNVLDRFDVSGLSCGNGVCDGHETEESCSLDCKKEIQAINNEVQDLNEESIFRDPTLQFALGLLAAVILFFVVRAIFIRKK